MENLIVIDSYGFLFRAYHALPPLLNPQGIQVGAIHGFLNMLIKVISEHKATHWVAVCDTGKKTFRNEIYPEYKTNRGEPDEELIPQFSLLKEALKAFNITCLSVEGYEADDIIATIAKTSTIPITIISSDKDLMQLITHNIKMFDPIKNKYIGAKDVLDKFGVEPKKLLDCFALIGDNSDNIPGVPGIGPKTAAILINEFNSLDNLLTQLDKIKQNKRRTTLQKNINQALLSRQLAQLRNDVVLEKSLDDFLFHPPKKEQLIPFLLQNNFKIIINRVENLFYKQENNTRHKKVTTTLEEEDLAKKCKKNGIFALYAHFIQDKNSKLGISLGENKNYTISFDKLNYLKEVLASPQVLKVSYNIKSLLKYFDIQAFTDIDVMNYTLNTNSQTLQDISYNHFGEHLPIEAAMQAEVVFKIYKILQKQLFQKKAITLYERLDLPSISVLHKIEQNGVLIDKKILNDTSYEFSILIRKIEQAIYKITECEFNIASPKQLSDILFRDIKGQKKLKSGNYSTSSQVLEPLALQGNEIAQKVLAWRHFSKLKNTYTDALLSYINEKTGRIHTHYSLTKTSTGRLSSSSPNLQNIPKKSNNDIRRAFIAPHNYYLISADYSQIELRLLAHMADMKDLKQALISGEDIHSVTAKQIFGNVNDDLRNKAKAINFGIIYGISAFGLAQQLNISNEEAKLHIDNYFKSYPGIKKYTEKTKELARTNGYVKTIYGRRCYFKDINSKSVTIRKVSERAAINAPLQGSAADIMKQAMVKLHPKLKDGRIIMQIHDELVIEVPKEALEETALLIKSILEKVINLTIPMHVNISYGKNLQDLKTF